MNGPNVICIQVTRRDGASERLVLTGPLLISPMSDSGKTAVLTTATGMDHFFFEDGTYDGWGMKLSEPIAADVSGGDGLALALAIDAEREIIRPDTEENEHGSK